MMKKLWRGSLAVLVLFAAGMSSQAHAQFAPGVPFGPYQPPINPMINILRGGAPAAVNYFNLVQPQLAFNAAIGQLEGQQYALGQAVGNLGPGMVTGHRVYFGNLSHYYSPRGVLMASGGGYGGYGGMGTGGLGTGGLGTGGMGMGGMGMGGMGMGGMGMGGMGAGGMGMGGMGTGGMGMGGMGMGGMGMGGMGMGVGR